jgi:fructokinase
MNLYGAVEAGGTKIGCLIGSGPDDIRLEKQFPTTTPGETLENMIRFFREYNESGKDRLVSIGVASFGPLSLNPEADDFGSITLTPKPGWSHTSILHVLESGLNLPVVMDTDVNGAAFGEWIWGAGQGLTDLLYITIGTGIGGGGIINGKPIHGLIHPEMGHIRLPHDLKEDPFPGSCPFHQDCFEGLASGPAIEKRWGTKGENLGKDHPAWDLEAKYIALGLHNLVCCFSPQRIIIGGGVMQREYLYPMIRTKLLELLSGYIRSEKILKEIDSYIVAPKLKNKAGVLGALAMAKLF